jgi:glutathione S-transferase
VVPPQALVLTPPRVYRIPFSTNVERVALAAGHKGIELDWVDVDADDRSPVKQVSGQPLVPVLVDGELVLPDSTAIIELLERRVPEPSLYPAEPGRRAEVRVFVDWFNQVWKRPPNLIAAELERPEPDTARIAELGARMRASLDLFEDLLDGRDYLFGAFGAADCIAFPFLKYAVFGTPPGDEEVFHHVLVEQQPLGDGYPRLRRWVEAVDARPRS